MQGTPVVGAGTGKSMYYDTHAHYDDPRYGEGFEEMLEGLRAAQIDRILTAGTDLQSSRNACRLAERYDGTDTRYPKLLAAVGIHPQEVRGRDRVKGAQESLEEIVAMVEAMAAGRCPELVGDRAGTVQSAEIPGMAAAIGEIGLDYRHCSRSSAEADGQRRLFDLQLSVAHKLRLPVTVHSVAAAADTLACIRRYPGLCGVMHGYTGSVETAKEYVRMGWYIGIGCALFQPGARRIREVTAALPQDRILLETDSPYGLVPQQKEESFLLANERTRIPTSLRLRAAAAEVAEIREETPEEVREYTYRNGIRLLG